MDKINSQPDFQTLRDQWALRSPSPCQISLQTQAQMDRNANPHNEPYHNVKPRRSEAEICSDIAYQFADSVLRKQYGGQYNSWLEDSGYVDHWGTVVSKYAK